MVTARKYIEKVNNAVRKGQHSRRISVKKQSVTPSSGKHIGLAVTTHFKTVDEIRIPRGLPKTREQARRLESTPKGREIKKTFGVKRIPTEEEVLRHELYHVAKPGASERAVLRAANNPLPNRLPPERTRGFDKTR